VRGAWRLIAAAPLTGGIEVTAPASFATNSFPAQLVTWDGRSETKTWWLAGSVTIYPLPCHPGRAVAAPARGANEQWDQCQPRPDH